MKLKDFAKDILEFDPITDSFRLLGLFVGAVAYIMVIAAIALFAYVAFVVAKVLLIAVFFPRSL